jgi:hypothetical protein
MNGSRFFKIEPTGYVNFDHIVRVKLLAKGARLFLSNGDNLEITDQELSQISEELNISVSKRINEYGDK